MIYIIKLLKEVPLFEKNIIVVYKKNKMFLLFQAILFFR